MKYIVLITFLITLSYVELFIEKVNILRIEKSVLNGRIDELEDFYQAPDEFLLVMPVHEDDYKKISSFVGYRNDPLRKNSGSTNIKDHPSLDLTGVIGARVQSVGYGVIENKWYDKGYHNGRWYRGNLYFNGYVQVRLDNGMLASYGHVFEIIVYEGNRVIPGQDLARIDPRWSPLSTGAHLHFSLQDADDNFLQPQKYIEFDKFPYTSRKNTEDKYEDYIVYEDFDWRQRKTVSRYSVY